jgi:hypothetical protein
MSGEWKIPFALRNSPFARHETGRSKSASGGPRALFTSLSHEKKRFGGETPTDAKLLCRAFGHGCAWIARRPSIGVPPRLWLRRPNTTTQLQFRATRDEAAVGCYP